MTLPKGRLDYFKIKCSLLKKNNYSHLEGLCQAVWEEILQTIRWHVKGILLKRENAVSENQVLPQDHKKSL